MTKDDKLKNIHKKWLKNCKCELRHTATQGVPGHGSAEAEIVLIGEAPGRNEDKSGNPFVGAAGKFLDEMLSSIKLKREDVYITNVVKYRPPANRDPSKEEVVACAKWLEQELAVIKPKVVVLLGRHALGRFFEDAKIKEVHGTVLQEKMENNYKKLTFFSLYHPAAALYNGSMRKVLLGDFKKLPKVLARVSEL